MLACLSAIVPHPNGPHGAQSEHYDYEHFRSYPRQKPRPVIEGLQAGPQISPARDPEFSDVVSRWDSPQNQFARWPSEVLTRNQLAKFLFSILAHAKRTPTRTEAHPMKKRHAYQNPEKLTPFAAAYIAAALQLSGEEIGNDWTVHNLTPSTRAGMVYECEKFLREPAGQFIDADNEQAGNDFWLTRNGHGAGFWARPEIYGQEAADQLSEAARRFGACDLYEGDDKHVYQSPQVDVPAPTAVVFRAWKQGGEVIAIFPYEIHHGYLVQSFMHVGQHSGAGLDTIIAATRPATPTEYAKLAAELAAAPYHYKLAPIKRINYAKFRAAVDAARHYLTR